MPTVGRLWSTIPAQADLRCIASGFVKKKFRLAICFKERLHRVLTHAISQLLFVEFIVGRCQDENHRFKLVASSAGDVVAGKQGKLIPFDEHNRGGAWSRFE